MFFLTLTDIEVIINCVQDLIYEKFMKTIKPPKPITKNPKPDNIDLKDNSDQPLEGLHSDEGLHVSEEEYWEKYYHESDIAYEWNNGVLEVKPMADYKSSKVYRWFLFLLEEYIKANPIAKYVCLDIGFRLKLPNKTTIRKPDLALTLNSNSVALNNKDSTFKGIYDLCIEFLSDSKKSEIERDTKIKKSEYCRAGVKEYFIIDRETKHTAFYRLNQQGVYTPIPQPDRIIRSNILPGFQFYISDLYSQPDFHDRINDPVYSSFILLEFQEEQKQKEQEKQRADSVEKMLEQEKQRADALTEQLRKLGIDPGSL